MFSGLRNDIRAIFARDPAARSVADILLAYPGFHALFAHRIAERVSRLEEIMSTGANYGRKGDGDV